MWLILAPSESRMRTRPWYAPPFHDWSVMDPGVSSATRKAGVVEESLPSGFALLGRQPLLMRVNAVRTEMWIGVVTFTSSRQCDALRFEMGRSTLPAIK